MKKLLLLLLIAPVFGFGQVLTDVLYFDIETKKPIIRTSNNNYANNFINDEFQVMWGDDINDFMKFTVPNNKLWVIKKFSVYGIIDLFYQFGFDGEKTYKSEILTEKNPIIAFIDDLDFKNKYYASIFPNSHNNDIIYVGETYNLEDGYFIKGGKTFTILGEMYYRMVIYEYSLDSNSLSYNESETINNNSNTPILFPNPTSSLLALNSDKEYHIEVYDMAGKKVMALTGNTIDMSHLSSATYIVKALDKVENEEVSYKVVKN